MDNDTVIISDAKAAGILAEMAGTSTGKTKAADILAAMDAAKAANILAAAVDNFNTEDAVAIMVTMAEDDPGKKKAAAILASSYPPRTAATILDAMVSEGTVNSVNALGTKTAAGILANMTISNAAEIFDEMIVFNKATVLLAKEENGTTIISDAKAAEILTQNWFFVAKAAKVAETLAIMDAAKAAAILAAKNENGTAIISDAKAAEILATMAVDDPGKKKAAEILAAMVPVKAAEILADSRMPAPKAAEILAHMEHAGAAAKADSILDAMNSDSRERVTEWLSLLTFVLTSH